MALFAVLVVTVLLAGTPTVTQSVQVHPLVSNLLDELLKDILPSQGPCMFDYILKEVVFAVQLEAGGPLGTVPLCVSRFPQFKSATEIFDFVGNSTKVCPSVKDSLRCILTDPAVPCVSGLRTKLEPFIAKALTFLDCDVDEQFMLDVSNCFIRPLVNTNRSEFEDKVVQCVNGTGLLGSSDSPLTVWMDLYNNYVATQGNQSNICRIGRDFILCALQAYNETVWKSGQCNNVQSEIMRQLDDILDKLNCNGNRSGDVLTCLGNPALYNLTTNGTIVMCKWSEHFEKVGQGFTSLQQLPKRPAVSELVSQFASATCSSLNTLGQCTLQYLNASIGCNKMVVPTLANILTPLLDHISRASSDNDTCPVYGNGTGTTMAPPTVTQSPEGRPLLSNLLDEFLTHILPSEVPCLFDYIFKEIVVSLHPEATGQPGRVLQCVQVFPMNGNFTDFMDFLGNPTKVCLAVQSFLHCLSFDHSVPCVSGLITRLQPFIAEALTFMDCGIAEYSRLNMVNCFIRPLGNRNLSAFTEKLGQCAIGTGLVVNSASPLTIWTDLYDNYVATQGNQSKICRIVRDITLCVLQAYNETLWTSTECNNLQIESMRQLDDILERFNCNGQESGDVLTCLGDPALYNITANGTILMCKWPEHLRIVEQGFSSLRQIPGRPTTTQLVSQFARRTCSSLNTLGQCMLEYLSDKLGCNKTVVPTLANILTPLLGHINRASGDNATCPVYTKIDRMTTAKPTTVTTLTTTEPATASTTTALKPTTIPTPTTTAKPTTTSTITTLKPTTTSTTTTLKPTTTSSASPEVKIEVKFTFEQNFVEALSDPKSSESLALVAVITVPIEKSMKVKYGVLYLGLTDIKFSAGSINVDFGVRLASKPKDTSDSKITEDVSSLVTTALSTNLTDANGTVYSVKPGSVKVTTPPDPAKEMSQVTVLVIVGVIAFGLISIVLVLFCMCYCYCDGRNPCYRHPKDGEKDFSHSMYGSSKYGVYQEWPQSGRLFPPVVKQMSYGGIHNQAVAPMPDALLRRQTGPPQAYYMAPARRPTYMF